MARLEGDSAQESRYRQRVDYMPYRVALVFYICMSLSVVSLFALQGHTIREQCRDGKTNREAIRDTVTEGLSSLGARYDPETDTIIPHGTPIDYYSTHFEERQRALRQAIRTLERFPKIECGGSLNILGGGR